MQRDNMHATARTIYEAMESVGSKWHDTEIARIDIDMIADALQSAYDQGRRDFITAQEENAKLRKPAESPHSAQEKALRLLEALGQEWDAAPADDVLKGG